MVTILAMSAAIASAPQDQPEARSLVAPAVRYQNTSTTTRVGFGVFATGGAIVAGGFGVALTAHVEYPLFALGVVAGGGLVALASTPIIAGGSIASARRLRDLGATISADTAWVGVGFLGAGVGLWGLGAASGRLDVLGPVGVGSMAVGLLLSMVQSSINRAAFKEIGKPRPLREHRRPDPRVFGVSPVWTPEWQGVAVIARF